MNRNEVKSSVLELIISSCGKYCIILSTQKSLKNEQID